MDKSAFKDATCMYGASLEIEGSLVGRINRPDPSHPKSIDFHLEFVGINFTIAFSFKFKIFPVEITDEFAVAVEVTSSFAPPPPLPPPSVFPNSCHLLKQVEMSDVFYEQL